MKHLIVITQHNLSYFWYSRFYKDGTFIDLGINPSWFQYMLENKYFNFFNEVIICAQKWPESEIRSIWTLYDCMSKISKDNIMGTCENYGIFYVINILVNKAEFLENFSFAAPVENPESMILYTKYFGILKSFGIYFRKTAESLIKEIERKGRLYFPLPKLTNYSSSLLMQRNDFISNEKCNAAHMKHFYLANSSGDIPITSLQRQYLSILAQGKTCKEAARIFDVSHRTIETTVQKLKEKAGEKTLDGLLQMFIQSGL